MPVYALCRRVDHTDAKLAYAQEVQLRPSKEGGKRLCHLLLFVHSCGIQGTLGGGGHYPKTCDHYLVSSIDNDPKVDLTSGCFDEVASRGSRLGVAGGRL